MSDDSQTIVDVDAGAGEAPRLAEELLAWLSAEGIVEPDPSDCILGEGQGHAPGPDWMDTVADWHDGNDDAVFSCPSCNNDQRLAEWRGPWAWGFGHLGLEFWNWPPLSGEFLRTVEQRLKHRTVLVRCHL